MQGKKWRQRECLAQRYPDQISITGLEQHRDWAQGQTHSSTVLSSTQAMLLLSPRGKHTVSPRLQTIHAGMLLFKGREIPSPPALQSTWSLLLKQEKPENRPYFPYFGNWCTSAEREALILLRGASILLSFKQQTNNCHRIHLIRWWRSSSLLLWMHQVSLQWLSVICNNNWKCKFCITQRCNFSTLVYLSEDLSSYLSSLFYSVYHNKSDTPAHEQISIA